MAKRKKKDKNPTAADLPQNPEFLEFAGHLRQIMSVPKEDIDRLIAEERAAKATGEEPMECQFKMTQNQPVLGSNHGERTILSP